MIGTAELEGVLDHADEVSETAVVGFPHEIKGEGIVCYIVLKEGVEPTEELTKYVFQLKLLPLTVILIIFSS